MYVSATGLNRNMGSNWICRSEMEDSQYDKNLDIANNIWEKPVLLYCLDGVSVEFAAKIYLSGNYRVKIDISDKEISMMIKRSFGNKLNIEMLRDLDISIDDDVISEALSKRSFKEIISLIHTE